MGLPSRSFLQLSALECARPHCPPPQPKPGFMATEQAESIPPMQTASDPGRLVCQVEVQHQVKGPPPVLCICLCARLGARMIEKGGEKGREGVGEGAC